MVAWAVPLAIAAGSMAAQWLSSSAAASASKEERQKMQDLVDKVQSPNFDPTSLTPEEYQVAGKYVPQVADFVAEVAPHAVELDQKSMDRQDQGYNTLQAASQDKTLGTLMATKAQQAAAAQAQANSATLKQDYAARGMGGGGLEFLDRLMAGQNGAQIAGKSTLDAEMQAHKDRLQNAVMAMDAARSIGQQKYQANSENAGIINSFNARTASRKQNWADNSANTMNDAQRYNLGVAQDVSNRNTSTRNQFSVNERDRKDRISQNNFENEMSKVRTQGGLSDAARSDAFKSAAQTNTAVSGAADIGMSAWDTYEKDQLAEKKKQENK